MGESILMERADVAAPMEAFDESMLPALEARLALLEATAAALAVGDEELDEAFGRALAVPGADRWPFDLARAHLWYGERLRRALAVTEARVHLALAREAFQRLGARTWADRAATELRATGQARHPDHGQALTPQELEIALLAATGMTNKQIGSRLYLSPRTVSAHLYRVFPKLGITSRAALRDALGPAGR